MCAKCTVQHGSPYTCTWPDHVMSTYRPATGGFAARVKERLFRVQTKEVQVLLIHDRRLI